MAAGSHGRPLASELLSVACSGGAAVTVLRDLRAVAQVTWVGRSSLEVCVDLRTRQREAAPWTAAGCGRFMIVSCYTLPYLALPQAQLQLLGTSQMLGLCPSQAAVRHYWHSLPLHLRICANKSA